MFYFQLWQWEIAGNLKTNDYTKLFRIRVMINSNPGAVTRAFEILVPVIEGRDF